MSNPVVPARGGTTSTFKTTSTVEVMKTLRRSMLDYANDNGGVTARDYLGERLFDGRPRDNALVFPYAVMRLQTQHVGQYNGIRLNGELEVQVYGRPWAQQETVYAVADLFDQMFLGSVMNRDGLIFCHGAQRVLLPSAGAPIDSEVVTVRLSYTLAIWPTFLTSLTTVVR